MSNILEPLREALTRLEMECDGAGVGTDLSRAQLIAVNEAIGVLRRTTDAVHAEVAAGIAYESRRELGSEGLAKQHGYRTPALLIAAVTGASTGDAARLVKVGEATALRTNLTGEVRPARCPHVREALGAGRIGAMAAELIVRFLDRVGIKIGHDGADAAERFLASKAPGLSLDEVRAMICRLEAAVDPDGAEPREDELRARTALRMFQRDGMLHLNGVFDPERAAPILAAIHGFVSAEFAAKRDGRDPEADDADRRSVPQIQADALVHLATHALGCDNTDTLGGATVVVRVTLDDLTNGTGFGLIDGVEHPVSVRTVRRMAAGGGIIPWVCGSGGEILDWGRERRLFTRAQRLALRERDGGCAMCGLPPEMTKAHHIRWWARDGGKTDLSNGVLLCETCHHLIHDVEWEIRVDGDGIAGRVWFIPPPHIDPHRTPRLGGRARTEVLV